MTSTSRLRVVFAGTPEFAAKHLQALIDNEEQANYELVAVYSQPDRPAGRGKKLSASPVKVLATAQDIPVFQPQNFKLTEDRQTLAALKADVMVVVAYGLLLPESVLDLPTYGCINVHGSLLPRWRGAAPIQRAIESGDAESGVTIMQMDVGLDTGDMLLKAECPISNSESSATLHDKLIELGTPSLLSVLDRISIDAGEGRTLEGETQDDTLSTYASKISKQEALIDWALDADILDRKVRAFNPFPIAYTTLGDDRLRVWQAKSIHTETSGTPGALLSLSDKGIEVACGTGSLLLTQVQLPGKKAMSVGDLLKGYKDRFRLGELLGQ